MGTRYSLRAKPAGPDRLRGLERHFKIILKLIAERGDGDRYVPIARRLESEIALLLNEQSDLDRYRSMHQSQKGCYMGPRSSETLIRQMRTAPKP